MSAGTMTNSRKKQRVAVLNKTDKVAENKNLLEEIKSIMAKIPMNAMHARDEILGELGMSRGHPGMKTCPTYTGIVNTSAWVPRLTNHEEQLAFYISGHAIGDGGVTVDSVKILGEFTRNAFYYCRTPTMKETSRTKNVKRSTCPIISRNVIITRRDVNPKIPTYLPLFRNIDDTKLIFDTVVLGVHGLCLRLGMHIDDQCTMNDIKLDDGNVIGVHGDYGGEEAENIVKMRGIIRRGDVQKIIFSAIEIKEDSTDDRTGKLVPDFGFTHVTKRHFDFYLMSSSTSGMTALCLSQPTGNTVLRGQHEVKNVHGSGEASASLVFNFGLRSIKLENQALAIARTIKIDIQKFAEEYRAARKKRDMEKKN